MKTLEGPVKKISELFGSPKDREGRLFRLMRYVICRRREGRVLLYNVVTGHLVLASPQESAALSQLPGYYNPSMEQLVDAHFLVPEDYDEHRQVILLRRILRRLDDIRPRPITFYTIFPTTACNARCWYCFEKGTLPVTMTEETADASAGFINRSCGGKKVTLLWFGGEPSLAAGRIDRICEKLRQSGTDYRSFMISNGYLFNEQMADRAKKYWHLEQVQISVDGTKERYNRIKAYVDAKDDPYERVMQNTVRFLKAGIAVRMRLNFDKDNIRDFAKLASEAKDRFGTNPLFHLFACPVMHSCRHYESGGNTGLIKTRDKTGGEAYAGEAAASGRAFSGEDKEWINRTIMRLNDLSRAEGLYHRKDRLPSLRFRGCEADNASAIVINARGELSRCCEMYEGSHIVGNVKDGILYKDLYRAWNVPEEDPEGCAECTFFPACVKIQLCPSKDNCMYQDRNRQFIRKVDRFFQKIEEESHDA